MTLDLKPAFLSTVSVLAVALTVAAAPASADQIISLYSGNGSVGGADSQITFLQGPLLDTGFGSAFTATDFANAGTSSSATVINNHPAWITATAFNANAATAAVPAQ